MMYKLSIITINRNNAEGLRKTMESVFSQSYRDFEYIVVDGASTDESVDVLKEIAARPITHNLSPVTFTWLSEPDTGIYNAMNKGLKMAHGEYTLMLNSGDYLVDEQVLECIIKELHDEDIIEGNLIEDYPNGRIRNYGYGKSNISFFDALDGYFLHQAAFIRKDAYEKYGYYDDSYKKNADTYFFVSALAFGNATYRHINIDIANFDTNGISNNSNIEWRKIGSEENTRWANEHMSKRMIELHKTAPAKIRLYDTLHSNKFIWMITMLLVCIARWITPELPTIKKEKLR